MRTQLHSLMVGVRLVSGMVSVAGNEVTSDWFGYERVDLVVEGRDCLLVRPETKAEGSPWIWRTEFFGHEPQVDVALLGRGYHVAYMDLQNLYGAPMALDFMDAFYEHLTTVWGLSKLVVLEGFSRGGLFTMNWAARHPDRVACIYNDAPVCDLRSWPAGLGRAPAHPEDWARLLEVYGLTEEEALGPGVSPIDNLPPLAEAHIPLLHVCGEADQGVPIEENTGVVEERYRAMGGEITVIAKPNCDHHPHSMQDPTRIVNYVLAHTPGMEAAITEMPRTPYGYDYFALRSGLGRSYARFMLGGLARVAFLGGSITANSGWRDLVCDELRRRFPDTEFDFINAGIPSYDSTAAAFRLARDVLSHGPVDLLFVEAAVNDSTNGRTPVEQLRGMEGAVRHALLDNPAIDIVMLHFADPEKIETLRGGRVPEVIEVHERVAEHYGVASIDLAREVMERIHAGEFTWEGDFLDLHPSPFGQEVYFRSISRMLDAAWQTPVAPLEPRPLPHELDPFCYSRGRLVSIEVARSESGWRIDPAWRPADGVPARMEGIPVLIAEEPGATLRLSFEGTAIGLLNLAGPDAGVVEFGIDGGPFERRDLFTAWSAGLHLNWATTLASDLAIGPHELTLRAAPDSNPASKGHAARITDFMVN